MFYSWYVFRSCTPTGIFALSCWCDWYKEQTSPITFDYGTFHMYTGSSTTTTTVKAEQPVPLLFLPPPPPPLYTVRMYAREICSVFLTLPSAAAGHVLHSPASSARYTGSDLEIYISLSMSCAIWILCKFKI